MWWQIDLLEFMDEAISRATTSQESTFQSVTDAKNINM